MLFSYTLNFFALISSISVLAAPPPVKPVFDFDGYITARTARYIETKEGMRLARGDWLRRPHPKNLVWIISNRICTYLTSCSRVWFKRQILSSPSLNVISHAPAGLIDWRFPL